MRRAVFPLIAVGLLTLLGWMGYLAWQMLMSPTFAEAQPLAEGDQEIAFIYPATSGDAWERLVAGLKNLNEEWPKLHPKLPGLSISYDDAFLEQSAAVPQISVAFEGKTDTKLWIRWYKLSGETDHRRWLGKLQERGRPPLAIIGGDISDRAIDLAEGLRDSREKWNGAAPLLLITTATADRYYPDETRSGGFLTQDNWPKLMEAYKDRTFRFCFTNTRMAEAVLDFVGANPHVWPDQRNDAVTVAATLGLAPGFETLGLWAGARKLATQLPPASLYTLAWSDDRYSQDLADRFLNVFGNVFYGGDGAAAGSHFTNNYVDYSVGDFYQPNPSEQRAVDLYLVYSQNFRDQRQLLAVPTGAQRARRFLRTLSRQAPKEVRSIVAISGDSISFNSIYRDREVAWNVLDLPVPLVFFSHRSPIDMAAGFDDRARPTSTQDLLLMRDILEALVQAAWTENGPVDAVTLRQDLLQARWQLGHVHLPRVDPTCSGAPLLFDAEGNRNPRRGEHVVWLQPGRERARNLPHAEISVWTVDLPEVSAAWRRVRQLHVDYNQAAQFQGGR